MDKLLELVFIPCPGMGHLIPMLETATRLASHDPRVSITFLVMKLSSDTKIDLYTRSMASALGQRVMVQYLPQQDEPVANNPIEYLIKLVESHKPDVIDAVRDLPRVSAFVVDMMCGTMMDVARSIGVPSYVFFPSNASSLSLLFYLQEMHDRYGKCLTEYADSSDMLDFPSFVNPLPAKVLPSVMIIKELMDIGLGWTREFKESKGMLVNTFVELEAASIKYLSDLDVPPIYPIGPIVRSKTVESNSTSSPGGSHAEIFKWLDNQPDSSVLLLCFGSIGSFCKDQVKEISIALENTGYRFLWSLKQPPNDTDVNIPDDYPSFDGILPEGFLERTVGMGKVIGWAPQAEILAHRSVGGFISHCGWNSILESMWFGVPIATWSLYSEQQFNAFLMVKELGLSVEIRIDYNLNFNPMLVQAEDIEKGIREVMKEEGETRKRVKEMSEAGKKALQEHGSSNMSLEKFIHDVIDATSC
ncbi:hypothetical protein MLD38_038311 [Melastoma candidum]|uniref:Uncharacterized protein n=1 Tax=Melastoma candidum TaxID=119954 RepID=A0ACB9KZD6_9MYRT|nr:hypothetical protein MLD38_038311 [Melastoma candidum]